MYWVYDVCCVYQYDVYLIQGVWCIFGCAYVWCVYSMCVCRMMCVWKLGDKVRDLRYDKVIGHVKSENIFHVGIQGQC